MTPPEVVLAKVRHALDSDLPAYRPPGGDGDARLAAALAPNGEMALQRAAAAIARLAHAPLRSERAAAARRLGALLTPIYRERQSEPREAYLKAWRKLMTALNRFSVLVNTIERHEGQLALRQDKSLGGHFTDLTAAISELEARVHAP